MRFLIDGSTEYGYARRMYIGRCTSFFTLKKEIVKVCRNNGNKYIEL